VRESNHHLSLFVLDAFAEQETPRSARVRHHLLRLRLGHLVFFVAGDLLCRFLLVSDHPRVSSVSTFSSSPSHGPCILELEKKSNGDEHENTPFYSVSRSCLSTKIPGEPDHPSTSGLFP
jgi:hypothetical protein